MAWQNQHPTGEELQDGLDQRVSQAQRAELDAHLASCEECRRTWDALACAKEQAGRAPQPALPEDLEARVRRALDGEDSRATSAQRPLPWPRARRAAWLAAGVAAILAVAFWFARRPDVPAAVARDHDAFRAGTLALDIRSSDAHELETQLAARGLDFPVRVLDLGMMRYHLVGGKVHSTGGKPSALFVYQGEDGHVLICEMYRGSFDELPAAEARHDHDGIPFAVFTRGRVTVVFWPEGEVLCVLAGEGGSEKILPLAFAKAMKATRITSLPED